MCSTGLCTKFTEPKRFNNFVQHFASFLLNVKEQRGKTKHLKHLKNDLLFLSRYYPKIGSTLNILPNCLIYYLSSDSYHFSITK